MWGITICNFTYVCSCPSFHLIFNLVLSPTIPISHSFIIKISCLHCTVAKVNYFILTRDAAVVALCWLYELTVCCNSQVNDSCLMFVLVLSRWTLKHWNISCTVCGCVSIMLCDIKNVTILKYKRAGDMVNESYIFEISMSWRFCIPSR